LYCSEAYVLFITYHILGPDNTIQLLTCFSNHSCRKHDLSSSSGHQAAPSASTSPTSPSSPSPTTSYSYPRSLSTIHTFDGGPDIIPRASPTTLRPRSYFAGDPFPTQSQYQSKSTPLSPTRPINSSNSSSTALASLRELSAALENTRPEVRSRHGSVVSIPPRSGSGSDADGEAEGTEGDESANVSGNVSPVSRSAGGGGVWSYVTFSPSAAAVTSAILSAKTSTTGQLKQIARSYTSPQPTRTPASSYTYGTYAGSGYNTGYANGGSGGGGYTRSSTNRTTYGNYTAPSTTAMYSPVLSTAAVGMERPLPPRSGGYSHRPRSMDLVTPLSAGY
jgi:hypothetical protein